MAITSQMQLILLRKMYFFCYLEAALELFSEIYIVVKHLQLAEALHD